MGIRRDDSEYFGGCTNGKLTTSALFFAAEQTGPRQHLPCKPRQRQACSTTSQHPPPLPTRRRNSGRVLIRYCVHPNRVVHLHDRVPNRHHLTTIRGQSQIQGWQFPHARHHGIALRPPLQQDLRSPCALADRQRARNLTAGHRRPFWRRVLPQRSALPCPRTHKALWIPRRAHRRAQLHHCLVEVPRPARIHQARRQFLHLSPHGRLAHRIVRLPPSNPAQHPLHVPIHHRDRLAMRNARNRSSRIRPNSRQHPQLFCTGRHHAAAFRNHQLRRPVQHASPTVIAQPAPQRQNILLIRLGQRLHRRKPCQECVIALDHHSDPRLLQHDLRHPDRIRILGLPPRQIAPAPVIPTQQLRAHIGGSLGTEAAGHAPRVSH